MPQIPSVLGTNPTDQPFGANNTFNDLNLDSFLKLMITELQNQDPLNPLENSEMLAQISQMREIGASDKLTSTLQSVLLGQNIASATNLIGSDVDAISDDNEAVNGTVTKVSIEGGEPRLQLDLRTTAVPSIEEGNLEHGEYSYRIVWQGADGYMDGIELSGDDAISTLPVARNDYQSIELNNLPITPGAKRIYRTDSSGEGDYRLVTTLTDGSQASYRDTMADDDRSQTRQTEDFDHTTNFGFRRFKVRLSNVSEIRAPGI